MPRGNKLKPVVGYGPVVDFVNDLRVLPLPTLETIAKVLHMNVADVSNTLSGQLGTPPRDFVEGVLALSKGTDPSVIESWLARRDEVEELAAQFSPVELSSCLDLQQLAKVLRELLGSQGLDGAIIRQRVTEALEKDRDVAWAIPQLSIQQIQDALDGRPEALRPRPLDQIVRAVGGTKADGRIWAAQCTNIHDAMSKQQASTPEPAQVSPPPAPEVNAPPAARPVHRPWRLWVVGAAVALVAVISGTLLIKNFFFPDRAENSAQPPALTECPLNITPTAPPATGNSPRPGALDVQALCQVVKARVEAPRVGRFQYTHILVKSFDSTQADKDPDPTISDEQLWWSEDRAGQQRVTTAQPGKRTVVSPPQSFDGNLTLAPASIPRPLADRVKMAEAAQNGPAFVLQRAAQYYLYFDLTPIERADILQTIANTPGVFVNPGQRNLEDRPCLTVFADHRPQGVPKVFRDILYFHSETGVLLRHERVEQVVSEKDPRDVRSVRTTSETVYLEYGRTDSIP